MVETVGIEPTSRDNASEASTSVFSLLEFRNHFSQLTGFRDAIPINLFLLSSGGGLQAYPTISESLFLHMGDEGRNRKNQLTLLLRSCFVLCQLQAMGVLYEDTQLDSQLKHDLPLSNPERPHLSVIELSIFTEEAFGEIIKLIFPNDKYYYNILTVNFNPP